MDARPGLRVSLALALALVFAPSAWAEPPEAHFSYAPESPNEGDTVVFFAAVSPDGSAERVDWDFGDGSTASGSDTTVTHTYTRPGSWPVTMSATNGAEETSLPETKTIEVNARPSVAFAFGPQNPEPGEPVLFAADARDDDPLTYSWDFGDGSAGTGSGPTHTYSSPGVRTVTLTVTDSQGAVGTASLVVDVRAPSLPVTEPILPVRSFMAPFPIVRLAGQVLARATVIRRLTVQGPPGALVRVRCVGRDCPAESVRRQVKRAGMVRFRGFERSLRPGTRLAIFVSRGTEIGKYTRFAIRAGKRPLRTDRCLIPGQRRPVRCS
jgi:PKD repeat protein